MHRVCRVFRRHREPLVFKAPMELKEPLAHKAQQAHKAQRVTLDCRVRQVRKAFRAFRG